jgi:hypothetical protein
MHKMKDNTLPRRVNLREHLRGLGDTLLSHFTGRLAHDRGLEPGVTCSRSRFIKPAFEAVIETLLADATHLQCAINRR